MKIEDLKKLLQTEEVISKQDLKAELENLLNKNKYSAYIYSYSLNISVDTYKYLLENHNLNLEDFFNFIIRSETSEKHNQLLDLALSKINWFSIYSLTNISINDLEKCLSHGLTLNQAAKLVLAGDYKDKNTTDQKEELVKYLSKKGANFSDAYWVPNYFTQETYKHMLEHGLKAELIFKRAIELEPGERHDQLLDLALSKINWFSIYSLPNISINDLEKCLSHGLTLEILLEKFFYHAKKVTPDNIAYNETLFTSQEIEILNKAKDQNIDINKIFAQFTNNPSYIYSNGEKKPYIIPEKTLSSLLNDYALDSNLILKYGIANKALDIVKLALANNADVNYKEFDEDYSLFVQCIFSRNIDMIDLLIDHSAKLKIDIIDYIVLIKNPDFNLSAQIIIKLPNLYSNNQLYEILRSHGRSETETRGFLDYHDLIKEYLLAKEGKETSLSKLELDILDGQILLDNIIEYKDASLTNKYGYSLLHLSIIANQYKLATKLVEEGVNVEAKTHNNITPLQLLSNTENQNFKELAESILDKIDSIDILIGSSETLTDILISNKDLQEKAIELTNDSLFYLFKKNVDLFKPSNNSSETNIAISHGDGFWSTGIWSTARLITENYPNVKIYLVKDDILAKGGELFIRQFDGVINPGAADTYPRLEEFTKADCPFILDLESHYQNMLEFTYQHNIPYLGICAGAQHLVMHHEGSLKPLEGYNMGHHQVKYIEGTLAHFMTLTKSQQKEALQNCELPEIKFEGSTAHNYAAVNDKLGNNIELGAVSEDNVAMSYAHSNGIRYATQFHPEHYYSNAANNNQKAWIDNFVELAQMHHEFRVNGNEHPIEYFIGIKARLAECLIEPTCIAEDSLALYKELYI